MGNNDIIVSNEKGTILNYFGSANTYDPFTNQSKLQTVKDLNFNIPNTVPFETADFVAVSTGLLATSLSFLNYCEFSILDKKTGRKIIDLKNYIGEIGNSSFYPNEEQIFWFNKDGLKGTFYLNKCHAGRVLHITSGMFTTTSITSGVLNDMFERTVGVPAYIQSINNRLAEQDRIIADTKLIYDTARLNFTRSRSRSWSWSWSWSWSFSKIRTIQLLYATATCFWTLQGNNSFNAWISFGGHRVLNTTFKGGGVTSIRTGSYGDYYDRYSYHKANNYPHIPLQFVSRIPVSPITWQLPTYASGSSGYIEFYALGYA